MRKITSAQNEEIKYLDKLKDSKFRRQEGKFLAEGIRICGTLISNQANLLQLYCTERIKDYALSMTSQTKITIVSDAIMRKISPAVTPSGIVCVFSIPKRLAWQNLSSGIILDNIADPGNMGTLIRTAAALNIKTVVILGGVDPYNSKVIQASAGTITLVNIFQADINKLLKYKKDLKLFALVVSDGKKPDKVNFKDALLIIGNEANGIEPELLEKTDEQITIPMPGKTESLNAAVAGSIAMYLAFNKN